MEKRTCPFASTNIDGDQCLCLDRTYICRPTYTANCLCVCLCHLSVIKQTNNTPLPADLFNPKPDAYLIKNLAANRDLPDIPNDFASSQILVAQHIKEPVPRTISAEKPITLSTILETEAKTQEASTSTAVPKLASTKTDQTEKPTSPDQEQKQTTEEEIANKSTEKETVSTPPAPKRLKLQRHILVDGFQVEKQFWLPTQAALRISVPCKR